jgi:hypothetical protein
MDLVHKPWTGVGAVHGGLYGSVDRRLTGDQMRWRFSSPVLIGNGRGGEGKGEVVNPFGASPKCGRR